MQEYNETSKNMSYEINDATYTSNGNSEIDNLLKDNDMFSEVQSDFDYFDQDNFLAQEIDYVENYTLKTLQHIAAYYKLPKTKIKKTILIQSIIEFETRSENSEIVYNRKRLWHYLMELKNDDYFSKFLLFTT
jgi:hypothetical protein